MGIKIDDMYQIMSAGNELEACVFCDYCVISSSIHKTI